MRKTILLCLFMPVLLLSSACVEPADEPTGDGVAVLEEPVPDDTVFEEVTVEPQADGTTRVMRRPITAGEERRQNEARMHARDLDIAAIVQDTSCPWSAIWIYDRTDLTGNRICFTGTGGTSLANHYRYWFNGQWLPRTWEISSGSFWPGDKSGTFSTRGPSPIAPAPITYRAGGWPRSFSISPNTVWALDQY